jgi:hypothetical protein
MDDLGEAAALALEASKTESGARGARYLAEIALAARLRLTVSDDIPAAWEAATDDERQAVLDEMAGQWTAKLLECAQRVLAGRELLGSPAAPDPDTVAMYAVPLLGNPGIDPD